MQIFKKQEIREEEPEMLVSVDQLFEEVVGYCLRPESTLINRVETGRLSRAQFVEELKLYLGNRDESLVDKTIELVEKYFFGYYKLEELIGDDSVSDIKMLSPDNIRIKRNGKRMSTDIRFKDKKEYDSFVQMIGSRNGVSLSSENAIQVFTDKKTSDRAILRFNITGPSINSTDDYVVAIRKILKEKKTFDILQREKMLPAELCDWFKIAAAEESGMIFCGKGSAGKSTIANACLEYIPWTNCVLVIQQSDELFSETHPEMILQHIVEMKGEGRVVYSLKELGINGLLIDIDYFLIGEIKGDEALYLLNASYTGNKCWCTVHGNSARDALDKIADYIKYASDYKKEDILKMLHNMHTIVFMKDYKVHEIVQLLEFDENRKSYDYECIYTAQDGFATGHGVQEDFGVSSYREYLERSRHITIENGKEGERNE